VTPKITGQFGMLPATVATPLAMVLTELLQNALQHGFGSAPRPSGWGSPGPDAGIIEVVAARAPELLTVTVTDSGAGLPPGFDLENTTSLGLQIVRTLVEGELGGRISLRPRDGGGTIAVVDLPVRYEPEAIRLSSIVRGAPAPRMRKGLACRLHARTGAQAERPALERPPLVLAHAAPDASVLAAVNGPAEAVIEHLAPTADLLGLFNLQERGAAVSDREEQLWIYLATGGDVAPVHGGNPSRRSSWFIGEVRHTPLRACEVIHELCDMSGIS